MSPQISIPVGARREEDKGIYSNKWQVYLSFLQTGGIILTLFLTVYGGFSTIEHFIEKTNLTIDDHGKKLDAITEIQKKQADAIQGVQVSMARIEGKLDAETSRAVESNKR